MCIRLICQYNNIIDSHIKSRIIDYFISHGGNACYINTNPIQINEKTVIGPNLVHSNKYNGLLKYNIIIYLNSYFSRIISPFWSSSLFDPKTKLFKYNYKELNYINNVLLQLLDFFQYCDTTNGNYDLINYTYLANKDTRLIDAASNENRDIFNLKSIATRTQQFIKQLIIVYIYLFIILK